jgi:cell wall-associated NlpC family hydrolase
MRAWQAAGISLPRTTYGQVNAGTRIIRGQLLPGDPVFTNNDGHVQLYIGGGRVIE